MKLRQLYGSFSNLSVLFRLSDCGGIISYHFEFQILGKVCRRKSPFKAFQDGLGIALVDLFYKIQNGYNFPSSKLTKAQCDRLTLKTSVTKLRFTL
ncbi:hypothetical protein [Fischerella sp. JS2]|uniref:hypothetical protein n=1 Tax=Fischerella sp. JS2 TaxID=2597771 RepID=UPI0028E95078|nr:hypothetical protein [Fischerella sp. JS2]